MKLLTRARLAIAFALNRLSLRFLGSLAAPQPPQPPRAEGWGLVWAWRDSDGKEVIVLKEGNAP
jgi:hypothetical protein